MIETITIPSEVPEAIKWLVTAIVIPFLGYMTKKIGAIDTKIETMSTDVTKITAKLDGEDGLISRSIRSSSKLDNLAIAFAERGIPVRKGAENK